MIKILEGFYDWYSVIYDSVVFLFVWFGCWLVGLVIFECSYVYLSGCWKKMFIIFCLVLILNIL